MHCRWRLRCKTYHLSFTSLQEKEAAKDPKLCAKNQEILAFHQKCRKWQVWQRLIMKLRFKSCMIWFWRIIIMKLIPPVAQTCKEETVWVKSIQKLYYPRAWTFKINKRSLFKSKSIKGLILHRGSLILKRRTKKFINSLNLREIAL